MYGKSERCVGIDYKPCVDSAETECVGKYSTNYIYELGKEQKYKDVMGEGVLCIFTDRMWCAFLSWYRLKSVGF